MILAFVILPVGARELSSSIGVDALNAMLSSYTSPMNANSEYRVRADRPTGRTRLGTVVVRQALEKPYESIFAELSALKKGPLVSGTQVLGKNFTLTQNEPGAFILMETIKTNTPFGRLKQVFAGALVRCTWL